MYSLRPGSGISFRSRFLTTSFTYSRAILSLAHCPDPADVVGSGDAVQDSGKGRNYRKSVFRTDCDRPCISRLWCLVSCMASPYLHRHFDHTFVEMASMAPCACFPSPNPEAALSFRGFLFSGVLDVCFTQIHGVLIGKLFSAADTGFYSRALNTRQMPLGLLESIFSRVMFPIFQRQTGIESVWRRT